MNKIEILEAGKNTSCDYEFSDNSTAATTATFLTASRPRTPVSASNNGDRPTKRMCLFCKGEHSPTDCNVVTDKEKRHSIVRDARACFNCLNRHSLSKCKSQNCCKVCRGISMLLRYTRCAAKLDLKPETQEAISLSTFGGNTSSVKRINTATVYLKTTQEETIRVHVIIVPTIAAPSLLTLAPM